MKNSINAVEIWGGLECTINRVNDSYFDQLEYAGHYTRDEDIGMISSLGIKTLRYPVLWERHQPEVDTDIDWSGTEMKLHQIRQSGMEVIAGLVHHGSGPRHVNFFDGSFEKGLADYARLVAEKFPWIHYYTPVNEPLTTARFCGLYGHWYPHHCDELSFYKILLSECKAIVMAMQAIREINSSAELIQTDDLGKCYSTPLLQYQAEYENERRWLSYELICGSLTPDHLMWKRLVKVGIHPEELYYFQSNNCRPAIAGFNYYITSERYLDENIYKYDRQFHGGNGIHTYSDIEAVRVPLSVENGPKLLIREAWERLGIPIAITECHLYSTRDEQMRWFCQMLDTAVALRKEGIDVRAVTAWAILGLYGWNRLVTQPWGDYEAGIFNVTGGQVRPTALAAMIKMLAGGLPFQHPVLETEGWWQRRIRLLSTCSDHFTDETEERESACQPLLILDESGTFTKAMGKICGDRNIRWISMDTRDMAPEYASYELEIKRLNPWAVLHSPVDFTNPALHEQKLAALAGLCGELDIRFLLWLSNEDFDAHENILAANPHALILYASSHPEQSFHLLHEALNMLLDETTGVHYMESGTILERASI
ncbi:family 1 glycosylhydrolase [Dyadobacter flavalbus]|uniref:Family 1 glycosylhydrolase n=1 Tax=Dyadobacter flavalbus TaxID=2579942 RepID=A0A5M8QY83_9BACT|nr:family 1 glycosylhydrolase [Dyadobacter flavalbus]KAA6439383.1 family 1 glycosylhydrolase [Dyadobacter flavalbus]